MNDKKMRSVFFGRAVAGATPSNQGRRADDSLRGILELGPVVARPIRPAQAREEYFLVEQSGIPFLPVKRLRCEQPPIYEAKPKQVCEVAS